jgi:hypothetical protein
LLLTRFREPFHPELFLAFSGFFRQKEARESGKHGIPPFSGFSSLQMPIYVHPEGIKYDTFRMLIFMHLNNIDEFPRNILAFTFVIDHRHGEGSPTEEPT